MSSTAYERLIEALEAHGRTVRENGFQAQAQCPAHDDANPSLSIRQIPDKVLVFCHAGCSTADVLNALGLQPCDLYDDPHGVTYTYPDSRRVHRSPTKTFRQSGNTKGTALFHSDRIVDADTVYVVEGEQDVLAVESAGGAAVCSAMGAGKAHLFDWSPLSGKHVVIVADKDAAGRKHANEVVSLVKGIAKRVKTVEAKEGKDAADHVAAGHGLGDFVTPDDDTEGVRLYRATDLKPAAQPRWLAKNHLQHAAINLLIGDEGIGKSLLWVWVTAAVTTGKALPQFGIPQRDPQHVILVCTEDDWSTVVRPRLEVAGADLTRISVICTEDDGSGAPIFPRDIHLILGADPKPALVVVDCWLDTVPSGLSVRDPQHARTALHPWKEVATATDAAVLLLAHTNRVASPNARDRYGATGVLRQKVRLTLFAQCDDERHLLVGPEKGNNVRTDIAASVFAITARQYFQPTDDSDGMVPLLSYVGVSDRTAREHVAASVDANEQEPGGNPAITFLVSYITGNGYEVLANKVIKAGRANGFNEQELKDARRRSRKPRITSRKASMDDGWVWAIDPAEGGAPRRWHEGGEDSNGSAVPPSATFGEPVPGGITEHTPGMTQRVRQVLERTRNRHQTPCGGCGQPMLAPESIQRGYCERCHVS